MLAAIKWGALGELLWVAPLAGVAVCTVFSLVIYGASRVGDARSQGASGLAGGYLALATVAFVAFIGLVVFGISVITTK